MCTPTPPYVGGEVITLAHLDRRMYVLGYLAKEGRVFLMDKAGAITSYALCLAVLEHQRCKKIWGLWENRRIALLLQCCCDFEPTRLRTTNLLTYINCLNIAP